MFLKKPQVLLPMIAGAVLLGLTAVLWPASDASAQCGSQASSCKNCHEVQGQDPVNNDGTGWHQSHAFGDFCYICHAGNNQSMVAEEAHAGMVAPLSDVQAACQSCHPNDLMERAQVYAAALGVEVGSGGGATAAGAGGGQAPAQDPQPAAPPASDPPAPPAELVVGGGEVIDYNLRYAGKTPVNMGNIILGVMIAIVLIGGGGFAVWNERRLRGLPLLPAARARPKPAEAGLPLHLDDFPAEVQALLPRIAQLNPVGLHALHKLLENPEDASELLYSLSRLDPELVRKIRKLDRETRAVLLALSGM